jgi:hypothetical protein
MQIVYRGPDIIRLLAQNKVPAEGGGGTKGLWRIQTN